MYGGISTGSLIEPFFSSIANPRTFCIDESKDVNDNLRRRLTRASSLSRRSKRKLELSIESSDSAGRFLDERVLRTQNVGRKLTSLFSCLLPQLPKFLQPLTIEDLNIDKICLTYVYKEEYKEHFEDRFLPNGSDNPKFYTASERIVVADYILQEATYIPLLSATEILPFNPTTSHIGIETLQTIHPEIFDKHYPLHDSSVNSQAIKEYKNSENNQKIQNNLRQHFYVYWTGIANWLTVQPIDQIKEYFGEEVALYFAWMGKYLEALCLACLFGLWWIGLGVFGIFNNPVVKDYCNSTMSDYILCPNCYHDPKVCKFEKFKDYCSSSFTKYIFDNEYSLSFAILMCLWATLFKTLWNRYEYRLNYSWDLTDIDDDIEFVRPSFKATANSFGKRGIEINPVTGKISPTLPWYRVYLPKALSLFTNVLIFVIIDKSSQF